MRRKLIALAAAVGILGGAGAVAGIYYHSGQPAIYYHSDAPQAVPSIYYHS